MNAAAVARRDFIEQLGRGKSLGQIAADLPRACEMPEQDGKDLVRVDERPVGMHGSNAIAISIGGKSGIVAAAENGFAQCGDVRLDGFRVDAAEERIAGAANLIANDTMTPHQSNQQSAG